MTAFATYDEYRAALADAIMRRNEAAALKDQAKQAAFDREAESIRQANPQWTSADQAWTDRNQDDDGDEDFESD